MHSRFSWRLLSPLTLALCSLWPLNAGGASDLFGLYPDRSQFVEIDGVKYSTAPLEEQSKHLPPWEKGNFFMGSLVPGALQKSDKQDNEPAKLEALTVEELSEIISAGSIQRYRGECPCPYSKNRIGEACGVESAYYKPGGYRLYCYPEQDIRGQQILFFQKKSRQ